MEWHVQSSQLHQVIYTCNEMIAMNGVLLYAYAMWNDHHIAVETLSEKKISFALIKSGNKKEKYYEKRFLPKSIKRLILLCIYFYFQSEIYDYEQQIKSKLFFTLFSLRLFIGKSFSGCFYCCWLLFIHCFCFLSNESKAFKHFSVCDIACSIVFLMHIFGNKFIL